MAFLSQASHLGSLLLPHDAFQEHAAHPAEWSAALSSKGLERTCIRSGLPTFLHCACTAHSDFAGRALCHGLVVRWPLWLSGMRQLWEIQPDVVHPRVRAPNIGREEPPLHKIPAHVVKLRPQQNQVGRIIHSYLIHVPDDFLACLG